jgi:hypothetical protein
MPGDNNIVGISHTLCYSKLVTLVVGLDHIRWGEEEEEDCRLPNLRCCNVDVAVNREFRSANHQQSIQCKPPYAGTKTAGNASRLVIHHSNLASSKINKILRNNASMQVHGAIACRGPNHHLSQFAGG